MEKVKFKQQFRTKLIQRTEKQLKQLKQVFQVLFVDFHMP